MNGGIDGGVVLPNKIVRLVRLSRQRLHNQLGAFASMLVYRLTVICDACQSHVDCVTLVIYRYCALGTDILCAPAGIYAGMHPRPYK